MSLASHIAGLRTLSAEQLIGKAGQVLPPWVAAIVVIAIVWQAAKLTVALLPQSDAQPLSIDDLPVAVASAPGGGSGSFDLGGTVKTVVDRHLFGIAAVEDQEGPDEIGPDVEETNLALVLKGVIAAEAENEARAIIEERGGDEKVYSVGDSIPGNASLYAVEPQRVLLRQSGQITELALPNDYGTARPATRSTRRPTPRRTTAASRNPKVNQNLQQMIAADPAKLTDIIRPQPVYEDGQQRGYRVYPGRKRQKFNALGLRSGDLVIEINGTALDDPQRGMEVFRTLGDSSQVTVTVERNGQPVVLNLDTSILTIEDGDM